MSDFNPGEELDREKAEVRQKLRAAKEAQAEALALQTCLESQLELPERGEKEMFRRELSSIEEAERLEFESATAGGSSESSAPVEVPPNLPSEWVMDDLPLDWIFF